MALRANASRLTCRRFVGALKFQRKALSVSACAGRSKQFDMLQVCGQCNILGFAVSMSGTAPDWHCGQFLENDIIFVLSFREPPYALGCRGGDVRRGGRRRFPADPPAPSLWNQLFGGAPFSQAPGKFPASDSCCLGLSFVQQMLAEFTVKALSFIMYCCTHVWEKHKGRDLSGYLCLRLSLVCWGVVCEQQDV